ncbi:MAG: DUF4340 domain-containing protein [Luteolibacter sp.]|uniref:DUF4340 domain-containing protein n=1 Tax=Luteolibacter sp. TaxID=1962973 RepID=UPI0032678FB6
MRSLGFTLILALLAIMVGGLAVWQWVEGNFYSVLGAPPTPLGERIYTKFAPPDVRYIRVSQNGTNASFELGPNGWQALMPWVDRMDPRAAVRIIDFTLGLRVEDLADIDKVDPQKAGLRESGINIRLEGAGHKVLAKYKLGRQTPWLATVKDVDEPVSTVFIQPRDETQKGYIYTCTHNIIPLFKDNLKFLRDYRPLYFNPYKLQKIRVRKDTEFTLARPGEKDAWRITMPLDSAINTVAIKSLIEGLFELRAVKISDRTSVTLPTSGASTDSRQIGLTFFGSDAETVLEIFPPETPESTEVRATVSNRPDTVFYLPVKPEANLVSLANLPQSIDELRDPTLTHLNLKDLRGILIEPATGAEMLLSWKPPQPWMVTIEGRTQEANQERLVDLLNTAIEGKAIGFETDAATDFTPWGLDRPILKLRFLGENNQTLELTFGRDKNGGYFVNRTGTPTVMRIDQALFESIPRRPYEWRHSRLWSIDRLNLLAVERKSGDESPLMLRYDFSKPDPWTASRDGADLTASINPTRANYMLDALEGLKVTRWLTPEDPSALEALTTPSLSIKIVEKSTDDMGDFTGLITREVTLAPGSKVANPAFYYGRLGSDTNPFLMDRETYDKLATVLMEKN